MRKSHVGVLSSVTFLGTFSFFSLLTTVTASAPDNSVISQARLTKTISHQKAGKAVTYWVDDSEFIEFGLFGAVSADSENEIKRQVPDAKVVHSRAGYRLWRLSQRKDPFDLHNRLKKSIPKSGFSPILHENDNPDSPPLAIGGNLLVNLRKATTSEEARAWAGTHKLELIGPVRYRRNGYLVKCPPGLVALDTANKLSSDPAVALVEMNIWREYAPQ